MSDIDRQIRRLDVDLMTLRTLVAVVDAGGFSAAARRIGRTQSAVSLQIAKLEDRLQTKLLRRTSRHVEETPAGAALIAYARRILAIADEAALALTLPDESDPFRIGFADYLAVERLHLLLGRFRRAFPRLPLSLTTGTGQELRRQLENGSLDLVIAGPDGAAEGGRGTMLNEEPLVWIAADADAAPPPADCDDPLDLVALPAPCSYRGIAMEALGDAGIGWRLAIEAASIQAVLSAVRAGLGISAVPASAVSPGVTVLESGMPALPSTRMLVFGAAHPHPLAGRLIAFLKESLR